MVKKYTIFSRIITGICSLCVICSSTASAGAVIVPDDYVLTSEFQFVDTGSVNIKDGAKPYKEYTVPKISVKEVLKQVGISLGKEDTVSQPLTATVTDGMNIHINRVSYKTTSKKFKIKIKTVKKKTSKLYKGQKKVKKKGKKGIKKITYTKRLVNGKVVKTIVSDVKVIKRSKRKIVLVGTRRKNYHMIAYNPKRFKTKSRGGIGTIRDHNGKKIAYKRKLVGKATAYSYDAGSITATGDAVGIGGVAVNPRQIPYGSKLYIESPNGKLVYGYAVANDTGGFCHNGSGTMIDLFYPSVGNCNQFGRRTMNVYVLV